MIALTVAIVGFGVFSSVIGIGALPTSTLPVYGDTTGDGSRTTVAMLGDVNGDGLNDYAVGMPYADAAGATPASSTSSWPRGRGAADAHRTQPRDRLVHDHRPRRRIARLLARRRRLQWRRPGRHRHRRAHGHDEEGGAGRVYIVYGAARPASLDDDALSTGYSNDPVRRHASPLGSRYDGLRARLAHGDVAVGRARPQQLPRSPRSQRPRRRRARSNLHDQGGGAAAVIYGKPHGRAHQPRRPLGGRLPVLLPHRLPGARRPARRRDRRERAGHDGRRLARPRDGRAAGRLNGPDSGSVWIINGRPAAVDAGCAADGRRDVPVDPPATPDCRAGLPHRRRGGGRRPRLVARKRRRPERRRASPTSRSAPRAHLRTAARARARSSSSRGRRGWRRATWRRRLPLQRIAGAAAGAGLGASLAAAGDMDGDGRVDILAGAPGESSFSGRRVSGARRARHGHRSRARARRRSRPAGAGAQVGSAVAAGLVARRRRRRRPDRGARRGACSSSGAAPGTASYPPMPPTAVAPAVVPPAQVQPPPSPSSRRRSRARARPAEALPPEAREGQEEPCRPRPRRRRSPGARGGHAIRCQLAPAEGSVRAGARQLGEVRNETMDTQTSTGPAPS